MADDEDGAAGGKAKSNPAWVAVAVALIGGVAIVLAASGKEEKKAPPPPGIITSINVSPNINVSPTVSAVGILGASIPAPPLKPQAAPECPLGSKLVGEKCEWAVDPKCEPGTVFVKGRGCVANAAAPRNRAALAEDTNSGPKAQAVEPVQPSSPSDYLSFIGLNYGDTVDTAIAKLGTPENADSSSYSWASKAGADLHKEIPAFTIGYVGDRRINMIIVQVTAGPRLIAAKVNDPKLAFLAKGLDLIAKTYGPPNGGNEGWYRYSKYSLEQGPREGTVKFNHYGIPDRICTSITVSWEIR